MLIPSVLPFLSTVVKDFFTLVNISESKTVNH
jgi:hypothetical protein